jgi:hypothetical protein
MFPIANIRVINIILIFPIYLPVKMLMIYLSALQLSCYKITEPVKRIMKNSLCWYSVKATKRIYSLKKYYAFLASMNNA